MAPNIVALMPVKGHSEGIPAKNIKEFGGVPLMCHGLYAAHMCRYIDKVYVSTPSNAIALYTQKNLPYVEVLAEPSEISQGKGATTTGVMKWFCEQNKFDIFVTIQATSPFLTWFDLDEAIKWYLDNNYGSVTSGVRQKRFCWKRNDSGDKPFFYPVMHDENYRPTRQDYQGYLVENGAFIIMSREKMLEKGQRLCPPVGIYEMSWENFLEMDEYPDWVMGEALHEWLNEKR